MRGVTAIKGHENNQHIELMNTEIDESKPDHELAREELKALFESLGIESRVLSVIGKVKNDNSKDKADGWPCIAYHLYIGGEYFDYYLGIGHVKWPKSGHVMAAFMGNDRWTVESITQAMSRGKKIKPEFYQLQADIAAYLAKRQKVEPRAYEVLAHVCNEGRSALDETFEEWCASFGYDSDSIKEEKIYEQCRAEGKKVLAMLGRANFNKFAELACRL